MDERFSHKTAAEYLGITENTLNVWRCTKRYPIPFIKVGARVFYWKKDLDAWLESRTVAAGE
ncbi:MAG: excisionase [Pseudomonadales bacterium RIFCSPLOWO2_12_59_9]|nr:MAG: excisionase [Pseudomonadales bacterium RIFCSPLOWO2_12_59_9]